MDSANLPAEGLLDPAGVVRTPVVGEFPSGYRYGVTRYADLILRDAFPNRFRELVETLDAGGGERSLGVCAEIYFDSSKDLIPRA